MFVKCLDRFLSWLGPKGEKIEEKIEDGEENKFSAFGAPEVPALRAEFPVGRNSGLWPEVPAKRENRLSHFGIPLGRGPGTSPRKFPRKFPVVRKYRPPGRKFRPWKFPGEFLAKSFLGSLSGGVPVLLPGSSPGNFRWSRNSGLLAGSSGPGNFPWNFG